MSNWTPIVFGSSETGAGTYSLQEGYYEFANYKIKFSAKIIWTDHTGNGNMRFSLPMNVRKTNNKSPTGTLILKNVTLPEDAFQSFVEFNNDANYCMALCSQYDGDFLEISLPTSGTVFYSGWYMVDALPG